MIVNKPVFKKYFHIEPVESEGIFLLSEFGHFVLTGRLNELVVPLIDGKRTADEIVSLLAHQVSQAETYYALILLQQKGHIEEADDEMSPDNAAFWNSLGIETRLAKEKLSQARIEITALSGNRAAPMVKALKSVGLQTAETGDFSIVIVDDYLQPELETINQEALSTGKPWMLVKPAGALLWLGPIFVPGKTGCWQCLAQRLRGNREVESFLENKGKSGPFPVSLATLSSTFESALNLAAVHAARFIVCKSNPELESKVITLDVHTLTTKSHELVKRPQCSACGNPQRYSQGMPIELEHQQKTFIEDGGHRSTSPEITFKKYEHHISPITGVVTNLTPLTEAVESPLKVYAAGHNFAMKNDSLYFLRDGLRSKSAGKGMTDVQARTSALCEAIERYCGVFRGEEPRRKATYKELRAAAIHPNLCMNYSDRQYAERWQWLARGSRFQIVPLPFDENVSIDWTPIWSMRDKDFKYLPTSYCYYGYPNPEPQFFCWADSNGNAAGNTIEEAIYQGFLELVERDSICLWWYSRVQRPAVDLDSLDEPYIRSLKAYYASINREFWVLDLTADLKIPTFAAVTRRLDHPVEDIVIGFGAHLDARVGILRAITEMNQFIPAVLKQREDGSTEYAFHDRDSINWWQTATLANQPYLHPAATKAKKASDYPQLCSHNVSDDLLKCIRIAEDLGMETLVLDQTRPDVGLKVVKVIVPRMRHFWARFAPGRLYDVPVKLGWLAHPLTEDQLNPIPMFV